MGDACLSGSSQPYPWPASIRVDEDNAGVFKGTANIRQRAVIGLSSTALEIGKSPQRDL